MRCTGPPSQPGAQAHEWQQTARLINWLQLLRRGALVVISCALIAAFDTLIWPMAPYPYLLVHTLCIGIPTWLVVEFGRLLIPREHCRRYAKGGDHGWPKGWRGVALTAASVVVGFACGRPLGVWLLNDTHSMSQRDISLSFMITIISGAAGGFYIHTHSARSSLKAEAAAAERNAAQMQARLKLLQSQLEPHMLFNTLANLRALIGNDPATARHMLDRMDGFLRTSLNASRATAHPLATEFERLHDYLALMSIRMGPRLSCALHLPQELSAQPVPPLLLQPLVENAIKHGLEPCVEGGHVEVSAACEGRQLVLTVRDTGVGFDFDLDACATDRSKHFGLNQVFERVASTYGNEGGVHVQSTLGAGAAVRITLPLQQNPS